MAMPSDSSAVPLASVEIFYSYSHKDEALRDELEKHLSILKRQGVISGWHDRKISAGSKWAGEIDEHLQSAQIVLLLISSDFLASDYCYDLEMKRALARHDACEALVIPVILKACDWGGALFAKLQALPKDGKAVTSWTKRAEAFKDVAVGIRKAVEQLRAGNPTSVPSPAPSTAKTGALPRICNLPHLRNPNFTGREGLLKELHDSLTSGKAAALTQAMHGLGGVGKTQTAVEYIYRHAAEYDIVWWIRSEEPAKLASDYAALAEPLRLKERGENDQSVIVQAVRNALAARRRWLIVFDNANEAKEIREFLPVGATGHVLVTSRNPAFGGVAHPLKVEKMSEDEAVRFLLKRSGVDESKSPPSFRREREKKDGAPDVVAAAELAKELGYLPLALEHSGAYIEEKGATIAGYLKIFTCQQKALLAGAKPPEGYPATVLTTWKLSFDEVEKKSEAAAQLMNLCAFFAPNDIGREMLRSGAKFLPEPLATAVVDDLQWDDAVGALRKYSLVEVQDGAISVHRLVQAVVRDRLDEEGRKKWVETAMALENASLLSSPSDFRTWGVYARLLPHGLASEGHAEELGVGLDACAGILNRVGQYMIERADFSAARLALERAVRIGEAVYGRDHSKVAPFVNNLGTVLREQGELSGARACFERALKIGEAVYGLDHSQVAIFVDSLGLVLREQGDLGGARTCFERALKIDEAVYGLDHPKVAADVNNLGMVLREQGDLAGARVCYERALKIDETAYGLSHTTVAASANNLGNVLWEQGDSAGARACYENALKIFEMAYGLGHPAVATSVNNLGIALLGQGDLGGARTCFKRALKIRERSLGRDHPKTKVVRGNLEALS